MCLFMLTTFFSFFFTVEKINSNVFDYAVQSICNCFSMFIQKKFKLLCIFFGIPNFFFGRNLFSDFHSVTKFAKCFTKWGKLWQKWRIFHLIFAGESYWSMEKSHFRNDVALCQLRKLTQIIFSHYSFSWSNI